MVMPLYLIIFGLAVVKGLPPLGAKSPIQLLNNRYQGILIALDPHMPENKQLLADLEDRLTEWSMQTFLTTRYRAALGNITIIIPNSWTPRAEYSSAVNEYYSQANIIIEDNNASTYPNAPYVKRYSPCGHQQEYMHLTPAYIQDEKTAKAYGSYGNALTHELMHLVYGVGEEYSPYGEPQFYRSSGTLRPVACDRNIEVEPIRLENFGRPCTVQEDGYYEDDCFAYPVAEQNTNASLMCYSNLAAMQELCDEHNHNYEAPSAHNRECKGRSVWEVLRSHEHFKRVGSDVECALDQEFINATWNIEPTRGYTVNDAGAEVSPRLTLRSLSETQLALLGVPAATVTRLTPLLGLSADQVLSLIQNKTAPRLNYSEAVELRTAVFFSYYEKVESFFNKERPTGSVLFSQISVTFSTAVVSLSIDYPPLKGRDVWRHVLNQDWAKAAAEIKTLEFFPETREKEVAALLSKPRNVTERCQERNPPVRSPSTFNSQPTVRYVQQQIVRSVVVMDTSGSMTGWRIQRLREAAAYFIREVLREGDLVGLASFTDRGSQLAALTDVTGDNVREQLVNRLPTSAFGGTVIRSGVEKGVEILSSGNRDTSGSVIILISDGKDLSLNIDYVAAFLNSKEIILDTIRFTDEADHRLTELSKKTGGFDFFATSNQNSTSLYDSMEASYQSRYGGSDEHHVQLVNQVTQLSAGSTENVSLPVDESIRSDVTVSVTTLSGVGNSVRGELIAPNGSVVRVYKHMAVEIRDSIKDLQVGEWFLRVSNNGALSVALRVAVRSSVASLQEVITLSTKVLDSDYVGVASVVSELRQGGSVLLGAEVYALLDDAQTRLPLRDDGAGLDSKADDGIYTGSLQLQSSAAVRLRTVARAALNTVLRPFQPNIPFHPLPPASSNRLLHDVPQTADVVPDFRRTSAPVSYEPATDPSPDVQEDTVPPGSIRDLVLESKNDSLVSVRFTAPGDNLDKGQVPLYEVRVNSDLDRLRQALYESPLALTRSSNLSAPGEVQRLQVPLNKNFVGYLAVIAYDQAFNYAVSNIVNLPAAPTAPPSTSTTDSGSSSMKHHLSGVTFATVVLLLQIVASKLVA